MEDPLIQLKQDLIGINPKIINDSVLRSSGTEQTHIYINTRGTIHNELQNEKGRTACKNHFRN